MSDRNRLSQTNSRAWRALAVLAVSVAPLASAKAGQADRYAAHMAKSLAESKAEVEAALAKYSDRAEVKEYGQRLALIDKAALALIERIDKVKSEALARMLRDKPKVEPVGEAQVAKSVGSGDAVRIYSEFSDEFAKPVALRDIPDEEKGLLQRHYASSFAAAKQYVARVGASAAALQSEAEREVLEPCAVLPMLATPDSAWTVKDVDGLPKWMIKRQALRSLESLAVSIPRPLTALAMAQRATARTWTPAEKCNYLAGNLQRLIASHSHYAAKLWCQALIKLAEKLGVGQQATEARCQMAQLHEKSGSPLLAAMEAKSAMDTWPKSPAWGKAATLRLKNLYAARRFKQVNEEAEKYIADKRAKSYLPQVIYISWVARRRQGETKAAAQLQKKFLEQFPEHPLGADMYFASAMGSLADGDYDEASRLLEIVEYRYPNSKSAVKAKELQERLAKSRK